MTHGVVSLAPDEPLFAALERMAEESIRHVLVLDGEELAGILSNRDVVRATMANPERKLDLHGTVVRDVMTPAPLVTIESGAALSAAAEAFLYNKVNALPVLDPSGSVVGILTSEDVLRSVFLAEAPTRRPDL
jgi:CBS domain-containing protein